MSLPIRDLALRAFRAATPLWLGVCLLVVLSAGWLVAAQAPEDSIAAPLSGEAVSSFPQYSDRWRIGFGCANENGYVNEYDVSRLCAGWYHSWSRMQDPPRPDGIDYIQHLRVREDYYQIAHPELYNWEGLRRSIEANPGAIWVIGNEPDGRAPDACDERSPDEYARIYKRFYDFIKGVDATAQVAIGPIIQGTPVRMQWLTLAWDAYQSRYGVAMPVDVWTMHNQIVKEAPDQGADIPVGCDPSLGRNYGVQDNDNMQLFIEHVVRMRQWMQDHGQRNKPLYLTEYGVLQPEFEGYTSDRINEYMNASFTYMLYAKDSSIGMPEDGNRLVQRWAWFALNVPHGRLGQEGGWNGSLFNPATGQITEVGRNFARWACSGAHPSPTPSSAPPASLIRREVEHGSTHGLMVRGETNSASDCRYVHIDPNSLAVDLADADTEVVLNVYVPNTGYYVVWGRAKGIDYNNKSFNLRVAAYPWEPWYFGTGSWNWQKSPSAQGYYLEGRRWHTLRIGTRGGGQAQMDMLVVTSNTSYNPNGDSSLVQICNPTPTRTPTVTRTPTRSPTPTVTRTPMPDGPGRIIGSVAYEGAGTPPAASWARTINVSAHLPGDPVPAYEFQVMSDQSGAFEVPGGVLTGTYDVGVRDVHSLRNLRQDIDIHAETAPLGMDRLVTGDANGDDQINLFDFSLLATHYGSSKGQANYDERPDFNHDGAIGIYDFSLLATNYGRTGPRVLGASLSGVAPAALGNVSVYVSPSSKTALVGDTFTAQVYLNAGSNEVNAVEAHMSFNPAYLRVLSLSPASTLPQQFVHTYNNSSGTVDYEAGILGNTATGTFLLFTLQLRAQAPVASTSLSFGTVTVYGPGAVSHNVSKQPLTVSIPAATSTPTPTNTPVATVVPSPTATNTPAAGVQELVLQQGVNGYQGFEDTTLDAWDADTSQHTSQHLRVRSPGIRRALLRADVSALAPGTVVDEAALILYQGEGNPNPLAVSLYGVLRPWTHGEATWNEARDGVSWVEAGCSGAGSDRDATSTDDLTIFPAFGSYDNYPFRFDVTALVQRWVDDPSTNQGLVIADTNGSAIEIVFRSADYYDAAVRPKLVIRYRTDGATPTPSLTPSATPTVDPSPSATPPSGTTGTVHVISFEDRNGDKVPDAGEPGVAGVVVELENMQGSGYRETRATDGDGRCVFSSLQPGNYRLRVLSTPWPHRVIESSPAYLTVGAGADLSVHIPLSRTGILALPLIRQSSP